MQKQNFFIGVTATLLALACAPVAATPIAPIDPAAINTYIVQTADAASAQTHAAQPSPSLTATFTSTPRAAETSSPTPTITFVFILPGATSSLSAPTLAGINSGTNASKYGCKLLSTEPANNTILAPRTDFVAKWGVKNIGTEDWFRATMTYRYINGAKLHKVSSYSIPKGAETGKNVILSVDMETLKDPGTYTTEWALEVDNYYFCPLKLTIVVQKN